jgi:SAM-dependent methyltransferase
LFDNLYQEQDRYWWRDKDRFATNPDAYPFSLMTQMMLRVLGDCPAGRALDLGAGEGTDSIRLVKLGYEVDAVEISTVAVNKIRRFAAEEEAKVDVAVADIRAYELTGQYDVIICNGVLHYIEDKQQVVQRMQEATRPGGINAVSLWSTYSPVPDCHKTVPVFCDDENGIVTRLYSKWQTDFLYFEHCKPETSHSGSPEHCHSHIKLIARKPMPDSVP